MGKILTEDMAKTLIERFAKKQRGGCFACPRCGKMTMDRDVVHNATSRRAAVYVCDACGTSEALKDMARKCLPLVEWSIAQAPRAWGMLSGASDHLRIEGHIGTWYVIDEGDFVLTPDTPKGPQTIYAHLFLLEHEHYGDEAPCIIVDENCTIVLERVWNGFGDLEEAGWAEDGNE